MPFIEIDRDESTGLTLLSDASDPPRYYLQERRRHRSTLLAIGDMKTALKRFALWADRLASGDLAAAGTRRLFESLPATRGLRERVTKDGGG